MTLKAALLSLSMALPGLAHNTVHLENESGRPWRLEAMQTGAGAATAGLVVTLLDRATGQYAPLKPSADGTFTLPAKGRIALDTQAPLDDAQEPVGASYHFRLFDEAGRNDPGTVLYYTVSWYFACSAKAPCRLGRACHLGAFGEPLKKLVKETSPVELRITAERWPGA